MIMTSSTGLGMIIGLVLIGLRAKLNLPTVQPEDIHAISTVLIDGVFSVGHIIEGGVREFGCNLSHKINYLVHPAVTKAVILACGQETFSTHMENLSNIVLADIPINSKFYLIYIKDTTIGFLKVHAYNIRGGFTTGNLVDIGSFGLSAEGLAQLGAGSMSHGGLNMVTWSLLNQTHTPYIATGLHDIAVSTDAGILLPR